MKTTILTAGIACIIAAIVGGGLKAFNIEIPAFSSVKRQTLLACFGVVLIGGSLGGTLIPLPHPRPMPSVTDHKPTLVGIYPEDQFGIAQRNALQFIEQLHPSDVDVVHLQLPLERMKQGQIRPILRDLHHLLRTRNVLAVIGPSVSEVVAPVLTLIDTVAPEVPTFLLSAIASETFLGRHKMPLFRLSSGIDARAEEFAAFVDEADRKGAKVRFLVERNAGPTEPEAYGEQLLRRVVGALGDSRWRKLLREQVVTMTDFPQGDVAASFPELEQSIGSADVVILFGVGGDLKEVLERFYRIDASGVAPKARIVGWMNAWAFPQLAKRGAYHWQLIFEVTDAPLSSDGQLLGEIQREFASKFSVGPHTRDEIYAFDSGYAPLQAYLSAAKGFPAPENGQYYRVHGAIRSKIAQSLGANPFNLVSGRVVLANGGNARERLIYTRFDPRIGTWVRAEIADIIGVRQ
jgi:hypothetical protein